ncbi:MAG TPA: hemerythrin domain-containing protein [Candidatus Obscuribacterales bacterium]
MVLMLDDAKRTAIATQLADMQALQTLLIANEQALLNAVVGEQIRQQLQNMLQDDQKNMGILETVIIQYGVKGKPRKTIQTMIEEIQNYIAGSELTLFEQVFQHELLKHRQTMMGLLIHKAAQIVGTDVEVAISPLNTINFENRAHQEQLKGILEILGVRELTGEEPDQGLKARVEDAAAALSGVMGSVVTRIDEEISIRDLLLADHTKSDVLFRELLGTNDPERVQEYFGQLYQDVRIHGLAEEQVLYPVLRPYYEHMEEIFDQTEEVIQMLKDIKHLDPSEPEFKAQVEQLRVAVRTHIDQEEHDIFPKIKHNFSLEQQQQLATEFKTAKSQLQDQYLQNRS